MITARIPPTSAGPEAVMDHVVAVLVQDGANPFEFAIACEIMGMRRVELGGALYDFRLCAPSRRIVVNGGWRVETNHDLDAAEDADTVIVPCGNLAPELNHAGMLEQLRAGAARNARLVSYCTGAFALAESGVLDGRRATVHWRLATLFERSFPRVRVERNVLFLRDRNIVTSAGTAAAMDLLLDLVREDHGAEVARYLGRRIVTAAHRRGADIQHFDGHAKPRVRQDELADVLDWAHLNLHRPIGVADLAERACMSERSFARKFKEALGTTPHRWVVKGRLQRARELLEVSDLTIDVVAAQSGFGSAANLRIHFRRELGMTPTEYRRAHAAAT